MRIGRVIAVGVRESDPLECAREARHAERLAQVDAVALLAEVSAEMPAEPLVALVPAAEAV